MQFPWWLDPRKIDFKRSWGVWLVLGLVLLAGVFVAGRHSVKVEIREVTTVKYIDHVITRVVKVEAKKRVVYRERYTDPNGGVHEKLSVNVDAHSTENTTSDTERVGMKVAERTVTNTLPQWRVGVLVGAQLKVDPLGATLMTGVHAERRIVGPFFGGAWVLYPLAAGASLSMEW